MILPPIQSFISIIIASVPLNTFITNLQSNDNFRVSSWSRMDRRSLVIVRKRSLSGIETMRAKERKKMSKSVVAIACESKSNARIVKCNSRKGDLSYPLKFSNGEKWVSWDSQGMRHQAKDSQVSQWERQFSSTGRNSERDACGWWWWWWRVGISGYVRAHIESTIPSRLLEEPTATSAGRRRCGEG